MKKSIQSLIILFLACILLSFSSADDSNLLASIGAVTTTGGGPHGGTPRSSFATNSEYYVDLLTPQGVCGCVVSISGATLLSGTCEDIYNGRVRFRILTDGDASSNTTVSITDGCSANEIYSTVSGVWGHKSSY